ncbi:bifunctional riboflavin kinase/FAD synthetase [Devriesea agamarum]|uniref:bifunctional riboflavin kinase/FAD synthetase n=1 Tax=Devriesea agamarum TaxID=472569 RepID=UPI00071D7328|nr:bifunctional riboflavin kinase/FAD synthetase [Devriesea agamarum]
MSARPIWRRLEDVPADLGPTAVAIGNFDGVHRGHQHILSQLARCADANGLAPVALTFWPHPRHVMAPGKGPALITSMSERNRLLVLAGMRGVLDIEFTRAFARHSAEDFVRSLLVEGLGMKAIVMGADSRFGRGNEGDVQTMRSLGQTYGFDVHVAEDLAPGTGGRLSSTLIRSALGCGDVEIAAEALGRLHSVSDTVHHGFARGRALGFPTANLGPAPEGLVPLDGVYAGYLSVVRQAAHHRGVAPLAGAPCTISIGTNPTFQDDGEAARTVEAYVHGSHDLDLYGDVVRIEFVARQRETVRFDTVEELVAQMRRDLDVTRRTLEVHELRSVVTD